VALRITRSSRRGILGTLSSTFSFPLQEKDSILFQIPCTRFSIFSSPRRKKYPARWSDMFFFKSSSFLETASATGGEFSGFSPWLSPFLSLRPKYLPKRRAEVLSLTSDVSFFSPLYSFVKGKGVTLFRLMRQFLWTFPFPRKHSPLFPQPSAA